MYILYFTIKQKIEIVAVILPAYVAVAALPVVFWFRIGKFVKLAALPVVVNFVSKAESV